MSPQSHTNPWAWRSASARSTDDESPSGYAEETRTECGNWRSKNGGHCWWLCWSPAYFGQRGTQQSCHKKSQLHSSFCAGTTCNNYTYFLINPSVSTCTMIGQFSRSFFFNTLKHLEVINMKLLPVTSSHSPANRSWEYSNLSDRSFCLDLTPNSHQ